MLPSPPVPASLLAVLETLRVFTGVGDQRYSRWR